MLTEKIVVKKKLGIFRVQIWLRDCKYSNSKTSDTRDENIAVGIAIEDKVQRPSQGQLQCTQHIDTKKVENHADLVLLFWYRPAISVSISF